MYWCKGLVKRLLLLVVAALLVSAVQSCKPAVSENITGPKFFDLKKYFTDESVRLDKSNPLVTKTASYNANPQTQKVHINNWETELGIFIGSDINKPAWKASYRISNSENFTSYTAIDSNLKTRYIIIKKEKDKVKLILVSNHIKSTLFGKVLYETSENLTYIPDSLYRIQKRQFTRMLGFNNYYVKGLLH
jgi:hypothetical protein